MGKKDVGKNSANVEFGSEFLDINASKAYEIQQADNKKSKRKKK